MADQRSYMQPYYVPTTYNLVSYNLQHCTDTEYNIPYYWSL